MGVWPGAREFVCGVLLDEWCDLRLQSAEDSAATAVALVDGRTRDLGGPVTAIALGLG